MPRSSSQRCTALLIRMMLGDDVGLTSVTFRLFCQLMDSTWCTTEKPLCCVVYLATLCMCVMQMGVR